MIYLVRHGETDWNLFKRFNGNTDVYLNKTGIAQAKALAEELKDVRFDVAYCSPLTRARQFCEIIHGGSIVFDNRLAEIDCGEFESREETAETLQSFWKAIQTGDVGTERIDAFINRTCEVCDVIAKNDKSKNILIVTHAANVRVINYYFKGKPSNYDFTKTIMGKGEYITLDKLRSDSYPKIHRAAGTD